VKNRNGIVANARDIEAKRDSLSRGGKCGRRTGGVVIAKTSSTEGKEDQCQDPNRYLSTTGRGEEMGKQEKKKHLIVQKKHFGKRNRHLRAGWGRKTKKSDSSAINKDSD